MDVYNEFELDRMFGIWNSAIWEMSSLIQMARKHRSTVIIGKVYKVFFHCDDNLHWANRPDKVLHSTYLLALEVEFKLALHLHNEGYDTDNIYDLPPMFKRTAHIHVVTSKNEGSFKPSDSQGGAVSIPLSTSTGRTAGSPFYRSAWKHIDDMPLPIMECNDEEEEYFPTATMDDSVWSKVPKPERDLCIHMAQRCQKLATPPMTTTYPQEPIPEAVTSSEEALRYLLSNMPDIIDNPQLSTCSRIVIGIMGINKNSGRHC